MFLNKIRASSETLCGDNNFVLQQDGKPRLVILGFHRMGRTRRVTCAPNERAAKSAFGLRSSGHGRNREVS